MARPLQIQFPGAIYHVRVLGLESGAAVSQQLAKWRQATIEERWRTVANKLDRNVNYANF